ncbi:DUF4174 domain-containing protein [Mesonia aestuariivivens]|uniref:DUF4174 domain-containing protein n=1 Tax=Mesonia aestuariivivens TaxID=2796128 RepID=A0ABS6W0N1_9FLAO|nr:DUF4174 domain-containing protein [Mesonia aestuariivivens]MBW2961076.1 DUF4174 domain-containing protein [Mesonia aestuariivivens]
MKNLLLILCITFSSFIYAQEPLYGNPTEHKSNPGFVIVVTSDKNLPDVQKQYDIFENGRKFFAERNIQPYLITPESVESFFHQENDRLMKFGNYQNLQQDNTDFLVIVIDEDYNTKYRSKTPITPLEISEVLE